MSSPLSEEPSPNKHRTRTRPTKTRLCCRGWWSSKYISALHHTSLLPLQRRTLNFPLYDYDYDSSTIIFEETCFAVLCFCLCSPISLEACFSNCSLERLAWSHSCAELNIRENQFRFTIVLFLVLCYFLMRWPLRVGFRLPESYKKAMTNEEIHGLK